MTDVDAFLAAIPDAQRQADCRALAGLMQAASGCPPELWSGGMVGFDSYHYRYDSGREGDWFRIGFASRKSDISLYLGCDLAAHADLLGRLGRHRSGKSCVYVRRLADIDIDALSALMRASLDALESAWPERARH